MNVEIISSIVFLVLVVILAVKLVALQNEVDSIKSKTTHLRIAITYLADIIGYDVTPSGMGDALYFSQKRGLKNVYKELESIEERFGAIARHFKVKFQRDTKEAVPAVSQVIVVKLNKND